MNTNPFREELASRQRPDACTVVIFGATGDLTHRKLIPALYNLMADGELPPNTRIVGFARRDKSDEGFRAELEESNKKYSRQPHSDQLWKTFASNIHYHQSTFEDPEGFNRLSDLLDGYDKEDAGPGNRLFYLSTAPSAFDDILIQLKQSGLHKAPEGSWARVIVEKPLGTDLATAQHLNSVISGTFQEADTYRIDHYLGKETAQNIMVLRFANAIFEPLWNNRYIDHVQITCAENMGMTGGRGAYYDKSGALRDMVQNHLLQLLSLVAMEPPADLSADGVRDAKVNVFKSIHRWSGPEEVAENVVRAQYIAGSVDGEQAQGYREEDRVSPQSQTETYVALRVLIETWRWDGVQFYIRVGKQLPKKATEISLHFKNPPNVLFNKNPMQARKNVLVIRIQPDEGISLRMVSKMPGSAVRMEPVKMDFAYRTSFGKSSPEAYERLLLDAMAGDANLFARRDEVENAWRFIDEIEHAWHNAEEPPPMAEYPAGSWGPKAADGLLERDGRVWRRL
ncbi:glucose-6-phosphate dehydrogenase [soil metagenome]